MARKIDVELNLMILTATIKLISSTHTNTINNNNLSSHNNLKSHLGADLYV